jgi:hypothetical protein
MWHINTHVFKIKRTTQKLLRKNRELKKREVNYENM